MGYRRTIHHPGQVECYRNLGNLFPIRVPRSSAGFAVLFGGVTGNQWQALKVNVLLENSERQSPTPASVCLTRSTGELQEKETLTSSISSPALLKERRFLGQLL